MCRASLARAWQMAGGDLLGFLQPDPEHFALSLQLARAQTSCKGQGKDSRIYITG